MKEITATYDYLPGAVGESVAGYGLVEFWLESPKPITDTPMALGR